MGNGSEATSDLIANCCMQCTFDPQEPKKTLRKIVRKME